MILKNSPFSIQDKNIRDLDNASKKYPTLNDLMKDQSFIEKRTDTVHRRRDLDSLG